MGLLARALRLAPLPVALDPESALQEAIELKARADGRPLLQPVASVVELRDWFNNRELGSYDGAEWRCWIARGEEVRAVDVTAKRLLW